jgi:hypothetical protein
MAVISTTTVSANGNYPATPGYIEWRGGSGTFFAQGTFDGATAKLQYSLDGTTWTDVGVDTTLTDSGGGNFSLGPCRLRVNVADVGTTSIQIAVRGMGIGNQ